MTTHTCLIALGRGAQLSLLETDGNVFVDLYEGLGAFGRNRSSYSVSAPETSIASRFGRRTRGRRFACRITTETTMSERIFQCYE